MTTGPLQLVVIGFDQLDRFRGQILAELQEVRGRDLIRLLDLLFVAKDEAGQLTALDVADLAGEEQASYGSLVAAGLIDPALVAAAAEEASAVTGTGPSVDGDDGR